MNKLDQLLIIGDTAMNTAANKNRPVLTFLLSFILVVAFGFIDYLTGLEIAIFSFYLIPIRLATIGLGLRGGIAIAVLATGAWMVSDYFAGQTCSSVLIFSWNMLMRLVSFLIVAWLSARNAVLFAGERATSARLQKAWSEIKLLKGMLPICPGCKQIRDEDGRWNILEHYIQQHSAATFTHSMCPKCAAKWAKEAGIEMELSAPIRN